MKSRFVRRLGMGLLMGLISILFLRQSLGIGQAARAKARAAEAGELRKIQSRGDGIYWNEQANVILHQGPVSKAFECFEKAVAADPAESVLWQNYAISLFVYRRDAMAHYHLDEQEVYDRVFELYDRALRVDPDNFALATDKAMTFYAIKPQRPEEALSAWQKVLRLANNDVERESIYLHLARTLLNAGRKSEARWFVDKVATDENTLMKQALQRRL